MRNYTYDIAFSFLAQDESLATQLASILEERYRVFLYSRRQEQLAGKDGETTFNAVFGSQARVVVILYREGWGESPWTRIEETAIKNRAYDEGYDFALFVPLGAKPSVPKYVPKTRLWIGLERFGINGAASVIDARVQEFGGEPRATSLEDRAARTQRAAEFKAFREKYLRSYDGVQAADASFDLVLKTIHEQALVLQRAAPILDIQPKLFDRIFLLLGTGPALKVEWQLRFRNSLEEACIEATIWNGHPPIPGVFMPRDEQHRTHTFRLTPDVDTSQNFAWQFKNPEGVKLVGVDEACEQILTWWLARAERSRS